MKNILVFFGGVSQESDVSVLTGVLTLNSLDKEQFNAIPVYIDKKGVWYTGEEMKKVGFFKNFNAKKAKRVTLVLGEDALYELNGRKLTRSLHVDCAINCLHGRNGEDGSLSGALRLCKIPFASPDIFSSAASLDKVKTKIMLKGLGIATAEYASVPRETFFNDKKAAADDVERTLEYPVIIKPSSSGSSIGITVARSRQELLDGLEKAFVYDNLALTETFMDGAVDINCAAMFVGGEIVVSECEKPLVKGEILSFTDKYSGSKLGEIKEFPAKIDKNLSDEIKETTKKIYSSFGFCGVIRADYLIHENKVYLNEINGVPGSLAYYLFSPKLSVFTENLTLLIEQGIRSWLVYDGCRFDYRSDILSFKGIAMKK